MSNKDDKDNEKTYEQGLRAMNTRTDHADPSGLNFDFDKDETTLTKESQDHWSPQQESDKTDENHFDAMLVEMWNKKKREEEKEEKREEEEALLKSMLGVNDDTVPDVNHEMFDDDNDDGAVPMILDDEKTEENYTTLRF